LKNFRNIFTRYEFRTSFIYFTVLPSHASDIFVTEQKCSKKGKEKKMQNNETEMGFTATPNHIYKIKETRTQLLYVPKIILIVALEKAFFLFQTIFQDFHSSRLEVCKNKSSNSSCLLTLK